LWDRKGYQLLEVLIIHHPFIHSLRYGIH